MSIGSILGQVGFANSSAYVAAKHGLIGLTNLTSDALEAIASMHAMARLGRVEDVAGLVAGLATAQASFATGAYYPVDGGYLAR